MLRFIGPLASVALLLPALAIAGFMLVLAGLHAGSGTEATRRMLDLGVEPRVLQTSLLGVLHQRLEVRPCPACLGAGCPTCGGLGRHRVAVATLTEPPAG